MGGKTKVIPGEARTIILKVMKYFEQEKANKDVLFPVKKVVKRTCAATGISERTLMKIKAEAKQLMASAQSLSDETADASTTSEPKEIVLPTPGRKRKRPNKVVVDNFDVCALRNTVNSFYLVKQLPTMSKIFEAAKRELNFKGEKTMLRKILLYQLGYKVKKIPNGHYLSPKPEFAAWKVKYLRRKIKNNALGPNKKPVTYLQFVDETWFLTHSVASKFWLKYGDTTIKKTIKVGQQRMMIVHVACETGFIQDATFVHKCVVTRDYRLELNTNEFKKWLNEKLIPNLPPNGIVVIDNAPHLMTLTDKKPTSTADKGELQNWLRTNNIPFLDNMPRETLFAIVTSAKVPKKHDMDDLLKEHGQEVLHLPPYHSDINPIEYIWKLAKQRAELIETTNNAIEPMETGTNDTKKDSINGQPVVNILDNITCIDWQNEFMHIERIEWEYWQQDRVQKINRRELVTSLKGDVSPESDNNESESEPHVTQPIKPINYNYIDPMSLF